MINNTLKRGRHRGRTGYWPKRGQTNFDSAAYDRDDSRAKEAIIKFLKSQSCCTDVGENPDDGKLWSFKAPDVFAYLTGGCNVLFEAQVNTNWTASNSKLCGRPRWTDFFCWHRKMSQICFVGADDRGYWATIRDDLRYAVFCPMDAPEARPRTVAKNPRYGKAANADKQELVFHLDLSVCKFADLELGTIEPYEKAIL